jgi:hypothetical protein
MHRLLLRGNARIKFFNTGLAETMAEFGLGMFSQIVFQLLPEPAVVTNVFA